MPYLKRTPRYLPMRLLFQASLLLCFTLSVEAKQLLSGLIMDVNENLIADARIEEEGSNNFTYSNADGTFNLFYSYKSSKLIISHPDFNILKVQIDSTGYQKVFLIRSIEGNEYNLNHLAGFTDFKMKNPNKHLENMPYLLGEADINRQLQMLPGVEHGSEGFSNLLIRGGNVDENLMLYNGTPVYNYNHIFGISSLFHTNGIDNVKLNKGAISAQYGGRLSSVIQVETAKTSEFSGTHGDLEISPLSAGLYIRSIQKGDHYFTMSFRRTYMDLLLPIETRQNELNANFYDLQLNYGKVLKNKDELELSFMSTKDNYLISAQASTDSANILYKFIFDWGNAISSVKYKQKLNKRLSAVHSLHYSSFRSNDGREQRTLNPNSFTIPTATYNINSGVREYIAQSNWRQIASNSSSIDFGLQTNVKTYRILYTHLTSFDYPDFDDVDEFIGDKAYQASYEIAVFGELKQRMSSQLELILGYRNVFYMYDGFNNIYPEPRLHAYYTIDNRSVLKLGANRHTQFIKLINIGGSGNPSNFWVPATEQVRPQTSNIIDIAYERKVGKSYSFSANAYYKQLQNIQLVNNFNDAINAENDWQKQVLLGSGTAYGLELMFQKNEGIFNGWFSYTYSKAYRDFEDLSVDPFLFDFDRTHMFKIYGNIDLGEFWDIGFNYVAGSGQLFSIPTGKFRDLDGNLQLEYNSINNYRSPFYHRLDLSILKMSEQSYLDQTWKFYIYNLYGTRNPLDINARFDDSSLTDMELVRSYLLPVPGISYIVKF